MPPKRKSTGATMPDATQTPSKRLRNSASATSGGADEASKVAAPETGEKRKRGRPRKNPETPAVQPETPKRGRGRPPKVASEKKSDTAAVASSAKRGRGRPPKVPAEALEETGQERPRKSLPAKEADIASSTDKKTGRGRPRLSLPAEQTDPVAATPRGRGRPRLSLQAKKTADTPSPKKARGRPRKSLPAAPVQDTSSPKKGRGRPSKSQSAEAAVESAEPANITEAMDVAKEAAEPQAETVTKSEAMDVAKEAAEPQAETATKSEPKEDTGRSYWLMKAEPETRLEKGVDVKFSIDDLAAAKVPEPWDGVRNAVARNIMREMKKGDYAFFYHSNCKVPGVVGIMEIVQEHSTDESAFDPKHPYYDPKSKRDSPKWSVVHVEFRHKLNKQVTLAELKANSKAGTPLENLMTLKQSRLSVSKVSPDEWRYILELAGEDPQGPKV